jgi:hypothetical protein
MVNQLVALAFAVAAAMGFSHPGRDQRAIITEGARACAHEPDPEACTTDEVIWGVHESSLQLRPKAESWDAKKDFARGPWQEWDCPVRLDAQAAKWVGLRRQSLKSYGDLRGLGGANDVGVAIAKSRAAEAADVAFALRWSVP